jgi:hypothetical protein
MPPRPPYYRILIADRILKFSFFTIRPYTFYTSRNTFYILFTVSDKCEQYYHFGRSYDLASPVAEIDRLAAQEEKLR